MYCRRGHSAWLKSHCHALTVVGQAGGALETKAFNAACTGWRYCDSLGVDDQTADERQSSRGGRDVVALLVALKSKACTSARRRYLMPLLMLTLQYYGMFIIRYSSLKNFIEGHDC